MQCPFCQSERVVENREEELTSDGLANLNLKSNVHRPHHFHGLDSS